MDKRVRPYELTYLIPGSYTDNEAAQVRAEVDGLLKKHSAKSAKTEEWGRKPMAYTMTFHGKKQHDALYVHVTLELEASHAPLLDREIFLANKVMRHLLLVVDPRADKADAGEAGRATVNTSARAEE
jgi:ribosomal protein S6